MDSEVIHKSKMHVSGKANRRYQYFKAAAMLILAVLMTAACMTAIYYVNKKTLTTEQVASKICPCVVGIVQYKNDNVTESGEGSGIIFTSDGLIVTNNHVIEGAGKLEVVTSKGKRFSAKAVGSDARTDLAVIKINASGLETAKFGDSVDCKVGEKVVAVGNPSGLKLAGSVTQGILSAINRDIDTGNGPMNLLQTDAAINPGNSGGALVDMRGNVIGINSAKISGQGYEGIGFSIPVSFAKPIINSIIKYGYVKGRVRMGINCWMLESITAKANRIPSGAFVDYVDPKSSACSAGIKEGDIIVSINNVKVTSTSILLRERDKHRPGDTIALTIYRKTTCGTLIFNIKLMEDKGVCAENEKSAGW